MLLAHMRNPPSDQTIFERFATFAAAAPDAVSLIDMGDRLTAGDLYDDALRVAAALRDATPPGAFVATVLDRGSDVLTSALGIFAAGRVLVPLAPDEPAATLDAIRRDGRVRHVIAGSASADRFRDGPLVSLDIDQLRAASRMSALETAADIDAVGCVLYRAGAEGRRDGILVGHRALGGAFFGGGLDITASDRVAMIVGWARDAMCTSALRALAAGACLIEIPSRQAIAPRRVAELLRDTAATVFVASTSLVERLRLDFAAALKTLRLVICDDDAWRAGSETIAASGHDPILYGAYGMAETAGCCALSELNGAHRGRLHPAHGFTLDVLDDAGAPVGAGQIGVLHVRAGASAPHDTGDLVSRDDDGRIRFCGRRDRRVCVEGRRIHPEEIEHALQRLPWVRDSRVGLAEMGGANGLSVMVRPRQGARPEPREAMAVLEAHVPASILPEAVALGIDQSVDAVERALVEIWAEVLRRTDVTVDRNFFDIGGQSMALVRVASLVKQRLGATVTLLTLATHPTVRSLAAHLTGTDPSRARAAAPAVTA